MRDFTGSACLRSAFWLSLSAFFPTVSASSPLSLSSPWAAKVDAAAKARPRLPRWDSAVPGESPHHHVEPHDIPEGSFDVPEQEAVQLFPETSDTPVQHFPGGRQQYRAALLEKDMPRCQHKGVGRLFIGDCLSTLHWAGNWAGYIVNCYNEDSPNTSPPNPT